MRVVVKKNYDECSVWAAHHIARRIVDYNPTESNPFVLGLPTGSTPLGTYKTLIELCKAGKGLLSCRYRMGFPPVMKYGLALHPTVFIFRNRKSPLMHRKKPSRGIKVRIAFHWT